MRISPVDRRETLGVLGVLLLAAVLRAIGLQSRGIWYDDAFSIFLAEQPYAQIVAGTAADTMPPLYYFLLHAWMGISRQVWFLRSLNVLLSLGSVLLTYLLGKDLFGRGAGLWAAVFAAVSPLQIFHAQEVRMYALLTLALLGYTWFFSRIWLEGEAAGRGWTNWAGLVLCGAAAMYSHNLAVFTLAAPNIFLVFRGRWRLLGSLVAAQIATGILALPWLVRVPGQISKIQTAFWTPRPGLVEIIQAVTAFHSNLPVPDWFLPVAIIFSFQILILVAVETIRNGRGDGKIHLAAALILAPPLLLFAASYFMRPVFVPRAFMLSSLVYYVLLGWVAAQAKRRGVGIILGGTFILLALSGLPFQYTYSEFPRSPFQELTAALRQAAAPGDVILHDNKLSYFPAEFYAPELAQRFLADEPGSHNDTLAAASQEAMGIYPVSDVAEGVDGGSRVWFVVFQQAIEEYREQGKPGHPVIAELEGRFTLAGKQSFNDLLVYEFNR